MTTLATTVIGSNTNLTDGEVADVFLGYSLATNVSLDETIEWDDLPLGAGSDLIDFIKSNQFLAMPKDRTYGMIARAWLEYRMARLNA